MPTQQTVILQRGAFLPVAALRPAGWLRTAFDSNRNLHPHSPPPPPPPSPPCCHSGPPDLALLFSWQFNRAAVGLCELHFGAISHVSVGTNYLRALSLFFYVWQSVGEFESERVSQASLSSAVSFSIVFPTSRWCCLFRILLLPLTLSLTPQTRGK